MQPGVPNETVKLWSGNHNKTVLWLCYESWFLDSVSMLLCRSSLNNWPGLYLQCTVHQHVCIYVTWGDHKQDVPLNIWFFFFLFKYFTHCCQSLLSYCTYYSSLDFFFFFCIHVSHFLNGRFLCWVSHISQWFSLWCRWRNNSRYKVIGCCQQFRQNQLSNIWAMQPIL